MSEQDIRSVDENKERAPDEIVSESTTTKVLNGISHIPGHVKNAVLYVPRYFGYFNETTDAISIIDNHLDTMDIILCNGQNYWFSSVVEYATWSKFSHIGLVLKSPTWLHPELTGNYFLESGVEKFPDAVDHKMKFGVQITDLEKMIKSYTGTLYFRKIISIPLRENPSYYQEKLKKIHKIIHNKPYDYSPIDLLEAQIRIRMRNANRTDSFFCSALVAFIYTQLGFLPADTEWDLVLPKDFVQGYNIEDILEKTGFASLGPMVRIK